MKKRYLRKPIQTAIEIITMLLIFFFGSLADFELKWSVVLTLFGLMGLLVFNTWVLNKYGKYEDEEEPLK